MGRSWLVLVFVAMTGCPAGIDKSSSTTEAARGATQPVLEIDPTRFVATASVGRNGELKIAVANVCRRRVVRYRRAPASTNRVSWFTSLSSYARRRGGLALGEVVTMHCPQSRSSGVVWGSGIYTDDSSICLAALHDGRITSVGGTVRLVVRAGKSSYRGTFANGVPSKSYGRWQRSFQFVSIPSVRYTSFELADCNRELRRRSPQRVRVETPWKTTLRAAMTGGDAVVRPDWRRPQIDPLGNGPWVALTRGWEIRVSDRGGVFRWRPTSRDLRRMIVIAGRARGVDPTVAKAKGLPKLTVTKFAAAPPLRAGRSGYITLTVTNGGRGPAYRVIVTSKSTEHVLHGLRFSLGKIPPKQSRSAKVRVRVSRDHDGGKVPVLLRFVEANNNTPDDVGRHIEIIGANRPKLMMSCTMISGTTSVKQRILADAGKQVRARCVVRNVGAAVALATHVGARFSSAGIGGKRSQKRDIRQGTQTTFEVEARVPAGAKAGQRLVLVLWARENNFGVITQQSLVIEVGMQRICTPPITRADMDRKRAKLKADLDSGLIDKAMYRKYEFQLLSCLRR